MTDEQQQPQAETPDSAEEAAQRQRIAGLLNDPQHADAALVDTAPPQAKRVPLKDEIAGFVKVAAGLLGPMFPSLSELYTDEVCMQVGEVTAPVCEKHGWLKDGIGGKYGPEVGAAVVLVPLALATYAGIDRDLKTRKTAARTDPEPMPLPDLSGEAGFFAPPSKAVTFGHPVPETAPA